MSMSMGPVPATILGFLKESFTENVGLKALSLGLAVGLFAFLYGQQDEQQRTIEVGVVTRPPPEDANRELMTQMPPTIHVTLRGPARALDELNQTRIPPVEIDLRQGHRKQIVFDPSMFSVEDARITIIDPPSIDLEWEDVISRQIPVQASISGQPAPGYVVKGEPEVEPPTLTVRGPTSLIEVMQFARLAPFDVSGLSEGTHRRRIAIDAPPSRVRFIGPTSAGVSVAIARRLSEAKFENRPVEVVGVVGATVVPRTVDVTVFGPPEIVRALKADQVVPRADLTAIPELNLTRHGTAVVKLSVELVKAEAEIQPPSVNVRF
jgi:YbbR domain-containing protein